MSDSFLRKKFIFNEMIDSDFLFSLYEDDFGYMEEIFKTTLDQLTVVVSQIPAAYNSGDVAGVRKLVHRIKPAFGFTGFLETEKACKKFEDQCTGNMADTELTELYQPFFKLLQSSEAVMETQYEQLKEFNNS